MQTSVGAHGTYKFSIENSMKLFSKVMGSSLSLTQEMVKSFFQSQLNMEIRNALAKVFIKNKYSLNDLSSATLMEKELSKELQKILSPLFLDYGVQLNQFVITKFSYDEDFISEIKEAKKQSILRKIKKKYEE